MKQTPGCFRNPTANWKVELARTIAGATAFALRKQVQVECTFEYARVSTHTYAAYVFAVFAELCFHRRSRKVEGR